MLTATLISISFSFWCRSLSELPKDIAASKRWRSGYWHKWYGGLDLSDDLDHDEHDDVLEAVLEEEDNNDAYDVGAATESVVGSPPDAFDERRSGPAAPDQEQQGGPVKSKVLKGFEVNVDDEELSSMLSPSSSSRRRRCRLSGGLTPRSWTTRKLRGHG